MELRNLITFIHVAELGSFTKAAERLGYSQSTISFQVKQLEEELNCLLFERINHSISLTERGQELVAYAHKIRSLTDELKENFEHEQDLSGDIHVVTPDSICEEMILSHYADFRRKYPHISIKFTTADTNEMFDMLDHNDADVIITLDSHVYHQDYIIAKEQPQSMHFVTSARSKFAGREGLSIRDILDAPFVLTERGQGYRRVLERELEKQSISLAPVLEVGRTDIIAAVLEKSDMISFLPDFVTEARVKAGELCYLDIRDVNCNVYKQLIYHKNKWLSQSLRAFVEYVKAAEFAEK